MSTHWFDAYILMLLDVPNLIIVVMFICKGRGPSPIPVLPWFVYMCTCVLTYNRPLLISLDPLPLFKAFDFVFFTCYHFTIIFGIPYLHERILKRKQSNRRDSPSIY